ncbi:C45 family autoproteolytic acyltransferase/hydolase [Indiicoccus explosivorum]|uniref:C45 family autoproteolytic acyltransferase/hydolase n=1 Tax=Indiicoccus explosivorum TaxID=1917864 RepID=UPI000B436EDF|nr:C45 family autoproteolytic acyltransferase/hydolase [Indiicoccus explosivorum]
MQKIYSDVLQFRGTHYDFGVRQGELLKDTVTLDNRKKQWKAKRPRFDVHPNEVKAAFDRFAPQIWEELLGLRDSLELPLEEVLLNFGGYRTEIVPSGCSIMTGDNFMVRNYDFHPQTYEGRFVLFQPADGGYALIGPSSRVTGRTDGINEKGLAVGHNFIHRKKPEDGFVCYVISRIVLETCATAEEAVDLLKEIPHRGSFSYSVYDKYGDSFVIDGSPRSVDVRRASACTNHFEIRQEENRNYLKDSHARLDAIQRSGHQTGAEAFRLFNDTGRGVFSKLYKSWAGTIHTSLYFPESLEVWLAIGGDQEPEVFDFSSWLKGDEVPHHRIFGEVDTDIVFAHMDGGVRIT